MSSVRNERGGPGGYAIVAMSALAAHDQMPHTNAPCDDEAVDDVGIGPREVLGDRCSIAVEDEQRTVRRIADRAGAGDVPSFMGSADPLEMIGTKRRSPIDEIVHR